MSWAISTSGSPSPAGAGLATGPTARECAERACADAERALEGKTADLVLVFFSPHFVEHAADIADVARSTFFPRTLVGASAGAQVQFLPATGEHEILEADHVVRMFCGAGVILPGTDKVLIAGGNGSGAPGQVLGGFTVACGSGAVEITRAQRAGKKAAEAADILRGLSLPDHIS